MTTKRSKWEARGWTYRKINHGFMLMAPIRNEGYYIQVRQGRWTVRRLTAAAGYSRSEHVAGPWDSIEAAEVCLKIVAGVQ